MKLDEFTTAYIDCMLWSTNDGSTPEGGEPMDAIYDIEDIDPNSLAKIVADCRRFQAVHANDIEGNYISSRSEPWSDLEMAGHDFWLTRDGHGVGFWDGDWNEPAASAMTKTSEEMGDVTPYVGVDGKIYT